MLAIVILFLIYVCRCQGFPGEVTDTATSKHTLLEDQLASLLRHQDVKLAYLTRLLHKHEQRLADQESLFRQQEEKLSQQERLLRQQEEKLSNQENDHRQQEQTLFNQSTILRQQKQKLSHQRMLLGQQDQRISHQETVLRQQEAKLSYQDRLLGEQATKLSDLEALLQEERRSSQRVDNKCSQSQSSRETNSSQARNRSQLEIQDAETMSDSTYHDVMPRSDDAEPLEAVVSQISQQVTQMGADLQTLKNSNTQQDLAIQDAQSSTFVHWGSSTCTSLSDTVYSGYVGGSWYDHTGAATNYLCLTKSPVFSSHSIPSYLAYLFGGEYETFDSHYNRDPVCAVCRSTMSTTVMIPGTNVCTPGWHLQYSGFLMAGHYGSTAASEYICVDSKLESSAHDNTNQNGKLLYYTVTHCGTLPCGPYVDSKVVTCAVCSK